MATFGLLLFIASFFIAFFLARKMYNKAKAKNPNRKFPNLVAAIGWYVLFWFLLTMLSISISRSLEEKKPHSSDSAKNTHEAPSEPAIFVKQLGEPKPYTVLKREDKTRAENNRLASYWILAPQAISQADRAATVRKAAEDFQAESKLAVISVFMQMNKSSLGKGYILASAKFFADGCQYSGSPCNDEIWIIDASKDIVSTSQLKIFDEWYKNRDKFLDKKDNLDEDKLTAYLAKKLKIPSSEVNLPFITTEKVNPFYSEEDKKTSADKMIAERSIIKAEQEKLASRKKTIESQFSSWDGSHIDLTRRIKDSMNDPDSYKHFKTRYIDRGDHITVFAEFGGRNGFGGMVRNTISADYTIEGNLIQINE